MCDALAHYRIGLNVLHTVIIHDTQVAATEGIRHGLWHLGLSLNHVGSCLFGLGLHFLFEGHCHGTALFSLGLCDILISICLINL